MGKTNSGLVAYAKAQLGLPYWYGTYGQTASASLYESKKKQYPKYYTANDFAKQYGKRVHDCVGLIKGYLWSDSTTSKPKYTSAQDVSANGMLSKCTEKGKIDTMPELPGVLVFMSGHVGVYIGGGYVIEAKGHAYGVVKTALKGRGWTSWGKCPWITYDTAVKQTDKTYTVQGDTLAAIAQKHGTTAEKLAEYNGIKTTDKLYVGQKIKIPTAKTVDEIAREVLAGKWGNGNERKKRIEAAGYDYTAVQKRVNELVK